MTVEYGTGLSDAESYVDISFADNYLSYRNPSWTGKNEVEKSVALVIATDFIDNMFLWKGKKKSQEQALAFPREHLSDNDGFIISGIPSKLMQAVCDAASAYINGDTLFQTDDEKGAVVSENVPGAVSITYDVSKKKSGSTVYQTINKRLSGLFIDTDSQSICVSRIEK
jgi:hypothetical protein